MIYYTFKIVKLSSRNSNTKKKNKLKEAHYHLCEHTIYNSKHLIRYNFMYATFIYFNSLSLPL